MNKKNKKNIIKILTTIFLISISVYIILSTLNKNINFFLSPEQIYKEKIELNKTIKIGGIVKKKSIKYKKNLKIKFLITDNKHDIQVIYKGILPDLFKEEQSVIAIGQFKNTKKFTAQQILAKHDENYISPEIKKVMS